MSAPRPVAAVPAILLVLVAVWEIAATRCDAHAVPGDDAWKDAAAVVRAGYRPGDLIVFAPEWADPIGRLHLGDLIPVELAARMDAARFGRIWEVSIRGAHHAEVAGLAPVAEESRGGRGGTNTARNSERMKEQERLRREERIARVADARIAYAKRERQASWDKESEDRFAEMLRRLLGGSSE